MEEIQEIDKEECKVELTVKVWKQFLNSKMEYLALIRLEAKVNINLML